MARRRYGIIDNSGVFKQISLNDIRMIYYNSCITNKVQSKSDGIRILIKFNDAYHKAGDYALCLDGDVVIGLKNNKMLCVWEMTNKKDTYKEFMF